ncbi:MULTISPECIES: YfcE family phosphodiesterase [Leuconostoc]|uniref:Phosphoesterase n=1 Tax=Leuconostoc gelidum subsp. gelidum TaxID=1607839 RepID=A0AB35FY90_LEUGE|nr:MULTISPECIES: YfcE family phosphodiesterase [Leuconostoc]MBR2276353.1 YfcE family phosphodiesterase [Leuconostoc sp.]MBZ5964393.1 YfcE family phosphodiesterase [Leuconostoc gelidum subsp. gelidum]MBZ5975008.1 YfcE family phosphodiesterase [Leuconostoc gelidum subsp. gelidum]MBZ5977028.1 YfcE family phosphodiesterase [Leuconostoc gelidum subsp. gelidum]MBZ5978011.1 YfcE family phosphodiesterase [Leuconostoc gelidum subsp. gelidum]
MSKFLIVSDNHGDRAILSNIIARWRPQVAGIFFNGDSELAAQDAVFDGVSTVIGNMDYDPDFVEARATTIDHVTFFQTHGHLYNVTMFNGWANLELLDKAALESDAQVVLFGHTHIDGALAYNGKLFINPGSTSLPKGPRSIIGGTYAVLIVEADKFVVHFYNRSHVLLDNLTVEMTR